MDEGPQALLFYKAPNIKGMNPATYKDKSLGSTEDSVLCFLTSDLPPQIKEEQKSCPSKHMGSILLPNTPTYSTTASHQFCSLIPPTAPIPIPTATATYFVQLSSCTRTENSLSISLCFSLNPILVHLSPKPPIICRLKARLTRTPQGGFYLGLPSSSHTIFPSLSIMHPIYGHVKLPDFLHPTHRWKRQFWISLPWPEKKYLLWFNTYKGVKPWHCNMILSFTNILDHIHRYLEIYVDHMPASDCFPTYLLK